MIVQNYRIKVITIIKICEEAYGPGTGDKILKWSNPLSLTRTRDELESLKNYCNGKLTHLTENKYLKKLYKMGKIIFQILHYSSHFEASFTFHFLQLRTAYLIMHDGKTDGKNTNTKLKNIIAIYTCIFLNDCVKSSINFDKEEALKTVGKIGDFKWNNEGICISKYCTFKDIWRAETERNNLSVYQTWKKLTIDVYRYSIF